MSILPILTIRSTDPLSPIRDLGSSVILQKIMTNCIVPNPFLTDIAEIATIIRNGGVVLWTEQMAVMSPHGIPSDEDELFPALVEQWQEKIPREELIPLAVRSKVWQDSIDAWKQDRQNAELEKRTWEDQKMFFEVWYAVTAKYDETLAGPLMIKYRDHPEVLAALNQL